jgi:hypothetical protein
VIDELSFDPWRAPNKVSVRFVDDQDEVDRYALKNALQTLQVELKRVRAKRADRNDT